MSRPAGSCPNCSAPIEFRWSSAVQTICPNCRSVVVRHDLNLEAIGEVSDLPADSSPIQIGTEGRWEEQPFTVAGRIVYEHEDGGWNEWHLVFDDGSSGWLSDAQAEYAVSRLRTPPRPLPAQQALAVGHRYEWEGAPLQVTTLTRAHYRGVEGELPFEYWGKGDVLFADLRAHDESFATIDYSEDPPLFFTGRFVEYDELGLRNVRPLDAAGAATAPTTRGFNCVNCGAAVELRALQHARSVACTSCGAIIDPGDPTLFILQEAAGRIRFTPTVPLGSRGTFDGHTFEVVGFQRRSITVEEIAYPWNEYVLFNPYQGFRYLSEYQGHWSVIRSLHAIPVVGGGAKRPRADYDHRTYRHFQSATAVTESVLGEFPWRVHAHDSVAVSDFVAPPRMLSREGTASEATWSLGEYITGADIWKRFELSGSPPPAIGVFAHQPSPYARQKTQQWKIFKALVLALILLMLGRALTASREEVFAQGFVFDQAAAGETAFVTDPFTLRAPGSIELAIDTDVHNSWVAFDLALVNAGTGTALNVAREISQYSGTDPDGAWTEGKTSARILMPRIDAGEYYLRVEPEGEAGRRVAYTLRIRRDVMSLIPYGVALLMLTIGPVWTVVRASSFEGRRWQESDYS